MSKKFFCTTAFIVALTLSVPVCSAAVGPVTSITTDNPPGSPPYNIRSITVGNYMVTSDRLATGTTTHGGIGGTPCPEMDDFDINTALNWNLGGGNYWTINFGGKLWKDSNGDNPDFFLFESGGESQTPTVAAIMPDGTLGQSVTIPSQWADLGYSRVASVANDAVGMDGQSLEGMSWAITDLLDAAGNPLNNNSVIEGVAIVNRNGIDPIGFFAVVPPPTQAKNPNPADEATDVPRDVVLGWTLAELADKHDVYFGTVFADINDASRTDPRGVLVSQSQDANMYDPDGLLEFGQTYYWRVDEVSAPPDSTIYPGEVWQFTVEPFTYPIAGANITATASSSNNANEGPENTINGSGLDDNDLHSQDETAMWLSSMTGLQPTWIQYEFDKVYKLHQMWVWNHNSRFEPVIGFGSKEVTIEYSSDGSNWTILGTTHQFARAPGAAGYAHNTTVDLSGVVAKYVKLTANSNWGGIFKQYGLSEVRFLYVPVLARELNPATGTIDLAVDNVTLSWRAGREAAKHNVYLSTDQQAVIGETISPISIPAGRSYAKYDTGPLNLAQAYCWKVNEVNEAETPASWQGDVLNFSTLEYLVVDDFEDYNDFEPDRIFDTWIDGWNVPTNGSQVGYATPSFAERTIIHGGKQSMPFSYDNSGGATYSEGERTFATPQDWTKAGIKTLTLYFHGDPNNSAGQLYVKINNSKVVYGGNAADMTKLRWRQWNIDLASLGVNLRNITKLSVGVDGNGAKGTLYFDDIRLYRLAPVVVVPSEEIWIEAEAAATITAPMKIYDSPKASGGKYIGTDVGTGNSSSNPPAPAGTASYTFAVAGGTYKISCRIIIPAGDSFWVRIPGATTQTTNHASGWVRWSDPPNSSNWYWYDVFSAEDNAATVLFTMPAGTHTLEIAYREDGALLDVIVISKIN